MANYLQLKAAIDQVIKANGQKEITGPVLNDTLKAMVNSLGAGYQFMGVAIPTTNPGTPDQKVFYCASRAGVYFNFGGIVLHEGIAFLKWNGSWTVESLEIASAEQVQSNWTQTDVNAPDYIKNKPIIPPSAIVDPVPTKDSENGVESGGVFDALQNMNEIAASFSEDGKVYYDFYAGDIFYIELDDERKYRVAYFDGTADAEHPVTIDGTRFYYADNAADAILMSLRIKMVSTVQQELTTTQKSTARENIAAVAYEKQELTSAQQVQLQNNMMGKEYVPADFSGLGKKVFAKNVQAVGGVNKNIMTQAFFEDEQGNPLTNTVFVIQYDYELGEDITIPANCILEFDGGSISGEHTITGTNTVIEADYVKIFNVDIELDGVWKVEYIYPQWFGSYNDETHDDKLILEKCVSVCNTINKELLLKGDFYVSSFDIVKSVNIQGNKAIIHHTGNGICINVSPQNITEWTQFLHCKIRDIQILLNTNSTVGLRVNQCVGSFFNRISINGTLNSIPEPGIYVSKGLFVDGTSSIIANKNSVFNNIYNRVVCNHVHIGFDIDGIISDSKFYNIETNITGIGMRINTHSSYNIPIKDSQFVEDNIGLYFENALITCVIDGCNIENYHQFGIKKESHTNNSNINIYSNFIVSTYNNVKELSISTIRGSYIANNTLSYSTPIIEGDYIFDCIFYGNTSSSGSQVSYSTSLKNRNLIFGYTWVNNGDATEILGNTYFKKVIADKMVLLGDETFEIQNIGSCLIAAKGTNNIYYSVIPTGVTAEQFSGASSLQGIRDSCPGTHLYRTDINKPIWKHSSWGYWVEYDGCRLNVSRSGSFAEKPAAADIYVGFRYFCTDKQTVEGATDGIEIIHKGNNVWVDALGRVVS